MNIAIARTTRVLQ